LGIAIAKKLVETIDHAFLFDSLGSYLLEMDCGKNSHAANIGVGVAKTNGNDFRKIVGNGGDLDVADGTKSHAADNGILGGTIFKKSVGDENGGVGIAARKSSHDGVNHTLAGNVVSFRGNDNYTKKWKNINAPGKLHENLLKT